jgi:hypothetical protein
MPKVDLDNAHIGDADSDALGKMQEELYTTLETELGKLKEDFRKELNKFEGMTEHRLEKVQNSVSSSNDSLVAF